MFDFDNTSHSYDPVPDFELYESEGPVAVPPKITSDELRKYAGFLVAFSAESGKILEVAKTMEQLEFKLKRNHTGVEFRSFCCPYFSK